MGETFLPIVSDTDKRRTTRVAKRVPITVTGIDALDELFTTTTETVSVSCHGCKYTSKHYVPKHAIVTIEITSPDLPQAIVSGRTVWVRRPRTIHQEFEIGVEFNIPQNVWGIATPPEDWLPFCKKQLPEPAAVELSNRRPISASVPLESSGLLPAPVSSSSRTETVIYDLASLEPVSPTGQYDETIERAVERSIARLSKSVLMKAVRQLPDNLVAVIVEKVRQEIGDEIDLRIERALKEANKKTVKASRSPGRRKVCTPR